MRHAILVTMVILAVWTVASGQTTEFTYQGSLTVGPSPSMAAVNYDLEFRLFSIDSGGAAIATLQKLNVPVENGIFTVKLDFSSPTPCAACFDGSPRWLEIAVRPAGGGGFQTLLPRQAINSTPYSIKSKTADTATNATNAATATNALQLGGVAANQFVLTGDARLSDARNPLPNSTNYIQNQNAGAQASSNFNVSGTGTANILNAGTQFNIGGNRILSNSGFSNLFAGVGAGVVNTACCNSFFGRDAGLSNTTGTGNAFFGTSTGNLNTTGGSNAFFGWGAGQANTAGSGNAFFGANAGSLNTTGGGNAFFGFATGQNSTTGGGNAFFGREAGRSNTTGIENTFIGRNAGLSNTDGGSNAFFGRHAGFSNETGSNNTMIGANSNVSSPSLSYATAIGADAVVGTNHSIVLGRSAGQDTVQIPGNLNVAGTFTGIIPAGSTNYIQNGTGVQASTNFNIGGTGSANIFNAATQFNLGGNRILSNSGDPQNMFVGHNSGPVTTGTGNAFFGGFAGELNTIGGLNSFFGSYAGRNNTEGNFNTFVGNGAGVQNTKQINNTFVGVNAGFNTGNNDSSFLASRNTFVGKDAGWGNEAGFNNTFVGTFAGGNNASGINNSSFGYLAYGSPNLINASSIGAYSFATQNNSLILGSISGVNNCTAGNNCNSVNVGIGTTAPQAKLHIGDNNGRMLVGGGGCGSANVAIGFGPSLTCTNYSFLGDGASTVINRPAGNAIFFRENNVDQMFIKTGGNVGIGTINPASKLHVSGIGGVRAQVNSDSNAGLGLTLNNQPGWSIATVTGGQFQIFNDVLGQNAVWIDPTNNNLGIGSTNPGNYRLDVASSEAGIRVTSTHPGTPIAEFVSDGPILYGRSGGAPGGKFRIIDRQSGSIVNTGIVEINNPPLLPFDPTTKLIVNGSIKAVMPPLGIGIPICQDPTSALLVLCAVSSLRYKKNIQGFNGGLEMISRLRPVTFDWKRDGQHDFGLVAEEVAQVDPLLVHYNADREVTGVKYDRIGVVAINAIKEQQVEIEALQKETLQQKEQIRQLTALVCSLKPAAEICRQKEQ